MVQGLLAHSSMSLVHVEPAQPRLQAHDTSPAPRPEDVSVESVQLKEFLHGRYFLQVATTPVHLAPLQSSPCLPSLHQHPA